MEVHHELLGADLTEHRVRHGKVCCTTFLFIFCLNGESKLYFNKYSLGRSFSGGVGIKANIKSGIHLGQPGQRRHESWTFEKLGYCEANGAKKKMQFFESL